MKIVLSAALSLFFLAFSCEGDKKENNASMQDELNEKLDEKVILADDFKGKLDEILTLELAAETSGYPAAEAKKSPDSEIEKKYNKISISYSWEKSNRIQTIEVMGRKIEAPKSDKVELSWFKNTTLAAFKKENHNLTEAELKQADEAITKKMAELNSDGKATKQQTDGAGSIAKNAMRNFSVEEVKNVGDYAVFANTKFAGVPVRELKVFYKGLSFQLTVDLSDDVSVNDSEAIALAQKIINQKLQ
ncbi:hypothetical protein [Flavobacterium sp.]|jgi:hypothetical protein|uniref:hypothetical protein n=1 Tax=Flavobacterium sp. TaxID=239 RepID=UPI0037C006E0